MKCPDCGGEVFETTTLDADHATHRCARCSWSRHHPRAAPPITPDVVEAEDEWTTDDAVDTTCDQCGNVRPCILTDNPFTAEVYPDDVPDDGSERTWWCRPCYVARADDI